jgi:hypothetical protein
VFAPSDDLTVIENGTTQMGIAPHILAGKSKGQIDMTVASAARAHLSAIMIHVAPGLPLKSALPRVAAHLKFNARRVRALWNREARSILHEEIAAMERELARISERELTTGLQKHANRLEGYASQLAMVDSDVHGEEITRLRNVARWARHCLDQMGA